MHPARSIKVDDDDRRGLLMSTLPMANSERAQKMTATDDSLLERQLPEASSLIEVKGGRWHQPSWFVRLGRRFTGWPAGVSFSALLVGAVLFVNVGVTIWAGVHGKVSKGREVLYEGDCEHAESLNTWIHLAINILSTGMLAASNYCMQRLSAPTRQEVDKAHRDGKWLDIGSPSLRNIASISKKRVVVWLFLAFSSLPLHLLYNSSVFVRLGAIEYKIFVVSESFYEPDPAILEDYWSSEYDLAMGVYASQLSELLWLHNHSTSLTRLEFDECFRVYSSRLVSTRGDVLITLNGTDLPYYFVHDGGDFDVALAACGAKNNHCYDSDRSKIFIRDWGKQPGYCMSQNVEEKCTLHFSRGILLVVIACNAIKLGCLLWTLWRYKQPTLVTLGDAIASFLEEPDPTTRNYCMASSKLVREGMFERPPVAQPWDHRWRFWFAASSRERWAMCYILSGVALVAACVLLSQGLMTLRAQNVPAWWKMKLGETSLAALVTYGHTVVSSTLLANLPQLLVSGLYLFHNSLYTSQSVAREWSEYGQRARPLRVTVPKGQQTSTYYLGLQYRYAMPLMGMLTLLHWLISRSIFLVNIDYFNYLGEPGHGAYDMQSNSISRCGFSALGLMLSTITGAVIVLAGIVNGFRRYPAGIPIAATCSLAISAACHVPAAELKECPDVALRPVRWGVSDVGPEGIGHCSFSHHLVDKPTREGRYMGYKDS